MAKIEQFRRVRRAVSTTFTQERINLVIRIFKKDRMGQIGIVLFTFFAFLAVAGPYLTPHDPMEMQRAADGTVKSLYSPSLEHPFGTTNMGRDIFSQTIAGTRVAFIVGVSAGTVVIAIGTTVGIVSGYVGGYVDDAFMRLTDIAYGIPFLPFAIALVFIIGPSITNMVLAIGLLLWRSSARVIRSQTLTLKERPYIEAAKASGVSNRRIMTHHIFPNIVPISVLYMAMAMAWAIMAEANLSFLGYGDPEMVSWGGMIFRAYSSDLILSQPLWVLPPGIAIILLVMSVFMIGRTVEEVVNPDLRGEK